jgi:hypothetical protein
VVHFDGNHADPPGKVSRIGTVRRFILHFLELQIPLSLGALVCFLLGRLVSASSSLATFYHPGTVLFAIGDVIFLTVPVIAWMIIRGHSQRRSLEMAVAMIAPVTVIAVLGELSGAAYLLWLVTGMYPTMCLSILVYMLYHRNDFTGRAGSSMRSAHYQESRGSMHSHLTIKPVGWSVGAALAVLYVVVMLASLLLVGVLTTGSWQAAFLSMGWSTIAGFEIGLLGVGIVGFAVAGVFIPIYNLLLRPFMDKSKNLAQATPSDWPSTKSWQVRLLAACFVLPALALVALRALASAGVLGVAPGVAEPTLDGPGKQTQPVNMGSVINTAHREAEPSFTADGRTMYFNCNSGDICVSHLIGTWEEGNWTPPERLPAPISTEYEEIEPVINAAGDRLYFTSIRPEGRLKGLPFLSPFVNVFRVGNILATAGLGRSFFGGLGLDDVYVSLWVDGAWSEPQSINDIAGEPPVNTGFADHCLFFSVQGDEAFWTSTRPGGFGDNDIWTSRREDGKWTEPENLGPNVNGPGSEHTSIPTPDGQSLYVTASRPGGFGGEDNYVSKRGSDGIWGPLINLGPLVNGPGDDRCPAWTPDLRIFLFDSVREGGFGGRDIWWVYFEDSPGQNDPGIASRILGETLTRLVAPIRRRALDRKNGDFDDLQSVTPEPDAFPE